ncbi:MAG: hypothetical protein ABI972_16195 [Acidobacteriota bacterium]
MPLSERWRKFAPALDLVLLTALAAAFIWPVFRLGFLDSWGTIESTFISDAHFLAENLPHPNWQPNWYCGTRWDYIYPPAIRYGIALIHEWTGRSFAHSYHLFVALFYCVAIGGVYFFVYVCTKSRPVAAGSALASLLISPGYLLLPAFWPDVSIYYWLPNRLNALMRWGEGPHMSAWALLPWALGTAWFGLRRGRSGWMAASAILCAWVVSTNFYGATALALTFPFLAWAIFLAEKDWWVWIRGAAIAALAYGLTASWLSPSYLDITTRNLRWVSQPGHLWSAILAAVMLAIYAVLTWRSARGRPERAWLVFVLGFAMLFTLNTAGQDHFDFRIAGEPQRLAPELDLALILLCMEGLRWIARKRFGPAHPRWGQWFPRALAVVLFICALIPAKGYIRRAWTFFPEDRNPEKRIEYRLTDWIATNMPGERILAMGSVRFWFNAWHHIPQLGGGSEQGMLNDLVAEPYYQASSGEDAEATKVALQAFGVDGIVVNENTSTEMYHDYVRTDLFPKVLEAIYSSGQGDFIYRIPRRYPERARIVRQTELRAVPEIGRPINNDHLRAYVKAIELGPEQRPHYTREAPDRIRIAGRFGEGEALVVQENYDPYWRAFTAAGASLPVSRDPLGFMFVEVPPGDREILLQFTLPRENAIGRLITLLTAGFLLFLLIASRRGGPLSPKWRRTSLAVGSLLLIAAVSFGLNLILFFPGESVYRDSIEMGYASIAKTISGNPNPWSWEPLHYNGLPTQFLYLPLLPYAATLASRIFPTVEFYFLWRLLVACMACLAPAAVWWMVRRFTRSTLWAMLSALAWTLWSPGYALFRQLDADRGLAQLPWRLQVLAKYGEGPHNAGLAILPLAILAAWSAATRPGFWRIFLAALAMAAVTLSNWIAAVGLAWCMIAMLLTGAGTYGVTSFRATRLLGAALLAYLMAAFWLTPSFISTMAFNWPKDAYAYTFQTSQLWMLAGLPLGAILLRVLFLRAKQSVWLCFLTISAFGFAWIVVGFYHFGYNTLPESRRYEMEFELFAVLLGMEIVRTAMHHRWLLVQGLGLGLLISAVVFGAGQVRRYAATSYEPLHPIPSGQTAEVRTVQALEGLRPQGRVAVTGGTRYRLNAFTSISQLGGTFESGLTDRRAADFLYRVRSSARSQPGEEGRDAVWLLSALGVQYVAVHTENSSEYFRDFRLPAKFEGLLPRVYDDRGDRIYRVPYSGLAHLIPPSAVPGQSPLNAGASSLRNYLAAIHDPRVRPPIAYWPTRSRIEIRTAIPADRVLSMQMSYHPGWQVTQGGKPIPTSSDALGFLVAHVDESPDARIVMQFTASWETRLLGILSMLVFVGSLAMCAREWWRGDASWHAEA